MWEWFIFAIWRALKSIIRKDGRKVNALYIVDRYHHRPVIVVDHSRNVKSIYLMLVTIEEYLSRKEEIIVGNLKKRKLKTKSLSKITTYIGWKRALSTISSRQNQSSASLKLRNYMFSKTWKLITAASSYI